MVKMKVGCVNDLGALVCHGHLKAAGQSCRKQPHLAESTVTLQWRCCTPNRKGMPWDLAVALSQLPGPSDHRQKEFRWNTACRTEARLKWVCSQGVRVESGQRDDSPIYLLRLSWVAAPCFSACQILSEQLLRERTRLWLPSLPEIFSRTPPYIFQAVQNVIATQARDKSQMFCGWLFVWLVGWLPG